MNNEDYDIRSGKIETISKVLTENTYKMVKRNETTYLIVMSAQEVGNYISMFGKQVLPEMHLFQVCTMDIKSNTFCIIKKTYNTSNLCLTLKVENASDATSKFGNSTNLKNNSKHADSNMYLRNHYKNKL